MTTTSKVKKYLREIWANDQAGKKINAFIQVRDEKDLVKKKKQAK